jgi:hypothetical protein
LIRMLDGAKLFTWFSPSKNRSNVDMDIILVLPAVGLRVMRGIFKL